MMEYTNLGILVSIRTGKLNANANEDNGQYPFFTCAREISRINTYAFDCECVLVAGNGELNVKYYEGKFNAYQRTYIIEVLDKTKLLTKYLYYFIDSYIEKLRNGAIGGVIKYIKMNHLTDIPLPLPDLETQNKIVAILDKANDLVKKREKTIDKYDELLGGTFLEMFLKLQGTNVQNLDAVAYVTSGLTKGKKYKGKPTNLYPYMRVANVQDGYLDLSEIKEIEATEEEALRYRLEKDDLLLTEGGDRDKLGRGTLWKNQVDYCIYQNHIFRVRVKDRQVVNPTFLSFQLSSQYGKAYFLKAAKQTSGIASINSTQLKAFPVYVPPNEEQVKFERIANKCRTSQQALIENVQALKNLLNSLSQLAFRGELTFNTAVELETLLNAINLDKSDSENDINVAINNKALTRLLVERLNKREFENMQYYEKGKYVAFRVLKEAEGVIDQSYSKKEKQVQLSVQ